jgi:hypothetical protein
MKKLIVVGLFIITLAFSGLTFVQTPYSSAAPDPPTPVVVNDNTASMIDDIQVPLEIVLYAQTKYQGSAITHASKVFRNGKQLFSLRVDTDTVADDYTSIYLLYDEKWQLVSEDKLAPPQPRKVETKKPEATKEESPAENQSTTTQTAAPSPAPTPSNDSTTSPNPDNSGNTQPTGGHGGGPGPTTTPTQ